MCSKSAKAFSFSGVPAGFLRTLATSSRCKSSSGSSSVPALLLSGPRNCCCCWGRAVETIIKPWRGEKKQHCTGSHSKHIKTEKSKWTRQSTKKFLNQSKLKFSSIFLSIRFPSDWLSEASFPHLWQLLNWSSNNQWPTWASSLSWLPRSLCCRRSSSKFKSSALNQTNNF